MLRKDVPKLNNKIKKYTLPLAAGAGAKKQLRGMEETDFSSLICSDPAMYSGAAYTGFENC